MLYASDPYGATKPAAKPARPKPAQPPKTRPPGSRGPSLEPYRRPSLPASEIVPAGTRPKAKPIRVEPIPRSGLVRYVYRPSTPKPQSEADVQFHQIAQAIGPKTVAQAANPRVAALQTVLGDVTGIPTVVDAARTRHHVAGAAVSVATVFPFGRFARGAKAIADLVRAGKEAKTAEAAAEAAAPAAKEATRLAAKPAVEHAAPQQVRHVPLTEPAANARLARLDREYEQLLKKIEPEVNPYSKEQAAAETRSRNTMRGRMAQGKKAATGKSAFEGGHAASKTIKTVAQEVRARAEEALGKILEKHPDHPAVKQAAALIAERDSLRAALNARAEAAFAGKPLPELPTVAVPVRASTPATVAERPGLLPGWSPQGQLFPRPMSPGRYPERAAPELLAPRAAGETPHVPGTPLSPQGEAFPRPPMTQAQARKANPLPRETPQIPSGRATERTGGQLGQMIRESMAQAKKLRVEQEQGYSTVRGERFRAFDAALRANPTVEGYHAALRHLGGELPKLHWADHVQFDQEALDSLVKHVVNHPTLLPGEKARTIRALERVSVGTVPTRGEIGLLEQVFGREVAANIVASVSTWQRLKWGTLDALNLPRSLMASFDVSAPFRQGLVMAVTHPVIFSKNLGPMFRALVSENYYQGILAEIHARPTYPLMEGRVAFTELGRTLSKREEAFSSRLAETLTGGTRGPVHASGRAYTGFLDKIRADAFDYLLEQAVKQGRNPTDEQLLEGIANFVNSATGRGSLGALQNHAVTLNTLLFSPRLLASRLNFINPLWYARLDPFARRQAYKAAVSLASTLGFILYLAHLGGAKVALDPRSADWAKIRVGDTRVDLAGGFQQPLRLVAQMATQQTISSTTGQTIPLTAPGPGKVSAFDVAMRFLRSKAAPIPSLAVDLATRQTFAGQPLTAQGAVLSRVTPLAAQDAVDLARNRASVPAGLGAYGLGALGVGIQTYKQRTPKVRGRTTRDPYSSGGGYSSDPYTGAGSYSSDPYGP